MGYKSQNGVVGTYEDCEVYVIDYKDLEPYMKTQKDTIYAVRCRGVENMELVREGIFIGNMSDSGRVSVFPREERRQYRFPQKQKEYKDTVSVEDSVEVSEINAEFKGFDAYSRVVDEFFRKLNEKEL